MKEYYQQEYIRCGKLTCRACPHGPYWYAYWWKDGKTRKRYVGKNLPGQDDANPDADTSNRLDDIFFKSKASSKLAMDILGLTEDCQKSDARSAFRKLTREHHPDLGGEEKIYKRIVAAWSYLDSIWR